MFVFSLFPLKATRLLQGDTPIMIAVRTCDQSLVETLLVANRDSVNVANKSGHTPLHVAAGLLFIF